MQQPAHVLIHHPGPVTDERALEAWTYTDLSYASGWEKVFVASAGDGLWRLCNLPHQVYGLKIGSVVEVDRWGRISRLVSHPAEPAYRIKLHRLADRDRCLDRLDGCWVEPMYTTFVGVQPRAGQSVERFNLALGLLIDDGLIEDTEDVDWQPFDPGPAAEIPKGGYG